MSSSYQTRGYQRPEEDKPDSNIAELIGTGLLAGAGLGSIAGMRLGRGRVARGMDPKKKEAIRQLAELNKKPAANAGVRQKDLNTVVAPSKVSTPKFNKKGEVLRSTVKRKETIEDLIDDELTVQNLTPESRSERARQNASVRRVQAAAADDIIDGLRREAAVDQAATASNSGANQQIGRVKHRLQQNEDVNLAKIEKAEDLADAAIQQQVQNNNIPLTETPNRDAGINLVSSQSVDGLPVDQAELVATGQGSVQQKQSLQNVGISSGGSSVSDLSTTNVANNLALSQADIDAMNKVGITGVKSAGVRTSLQDDNLRRKEFTPQQVERVKSTLKVEKPSSQEFVNEQLEQRLNKLQQETLELKAKQETLSRAAGLMSQGLNPETTRFDNALASGMVGRSGLKPSSGTDRSLGITDSTFQKNVVLSKNIEEALPTTQRLFYEQDTEGNIIPETVEKRQERPVRITQEDTKTLKSAGGRIGSTAQTKSVIGPYGIERENFPKADVTKRPTDTGGKKSFSTQPPAAGDPKESMTMAEEVRKVYNNPNVSPEKRAGKAQELLASKMKELNISAIGESQPLRKNAYRGRRRLR